MIDPIFVTGNQHKARYLQLWLQRPIEHRKVDLPEIQSLDLEAIVEAKVKEAYRQLRQPVLVEDVALTFHALGGLPGPFIKWFLEELGTDGLCGLLDGYHDRSAVTTIVYGLHDGRKIHYFEGQTHGRIAESPRGTLGFGWNAVFIPEGSDKTFAEMPDDELELYSSRASAVAKLRAFLYSIKKEA